MAGPKPTGRRGSRADAEARRRLAAELERAGWTLHREVEVLVRLIRSPDARVSVRATEALVGVLCGCIAAERAKMGLEPDPVVAMARAASRTD